MSDQTPVEETTNHPAVRVSVAQAAPDDTAEDAVLQDTRLERLLHFLRDSRSFDFTGYKRPSLMRRVRHRMREIGIESFDDYQDVLQLEPHEFAALFNTILINVTGFFRDSDAWDSLRAEVLPKVLGAQPAGRSGSGARAAPPARRPTRWRCCSPRRWAGASGNA